jgi:hypothetical protein
MERKIKKKIKIMKVAEPDAGMEWTSKCGCPKPKET